MRKILFDQRNRIGPWVAERVGRSGPWGNFNAFGVDDDGRLIAGVVFNEIVTGVRCSMHCAGEGKRWLSRAFLFHCFNYAFNVLGSRVIVNTVAASNTDSMRFTRDVGFTEAARIPEAASDGDLVIFVLHRRDCRWIGDAHARLHATP